MRLSTGFVAAITVCAACSPADDENDAAEGDAAGSTGPAADGSTTDSTTDSTTEPGDGTGSGTSGPDPDSGTSSGSSDADGSTGVDPTPAGYEGYGAMTLGAASCPEAPEEFHVTSLEDSGPGTLRDAVSTGCRHVVFDVGGTITLQSDLNIPFSFVTLDGATAPEPGITIEQPGNIGTTVEARNSIGPVSDIIISHLRMDGLSGGGHTTEGDIWGLDGEAWPVSNIIIDHVTARAATDGVFDMWEGVHDVTLSWNLVTDTLVMMHMSGSDLVVPRERISVHHNVFARNNERQIRMRHNSVDVDYRNNVVYGWGWMEGGAAGLHLAYDAGEVNPSINVVANAFLFVPGLDGGPGDAIRFERGADEGPVFFAGNIVPAGEADNTSNADENSVPEWAQVTEYAAEDLAVEVVPHVGTHFPTAEEQALLDEVIGASP